MQRGAENSFGASPKTSRPPRASYFIGRTSLSRLAVAHGQAGAGPKGETRLFFRHARRDLQHLIGDFEGKDLLFSLFKSNSLHGSILSFASGASSQLRVAQKNAPSQRHKP